MVNLSEPMGEVTTLTRTLVSRDPAEAGHAARVTALAVRLAEAIGIAEDRIRAIRLGGPLHDIGKLALDRRLLQKPGPLDGAELDEIRTHPERGVELVDSDVEPAAVLDVILHHHERWDGSGYPYGIQGEQIHLGARIFAVADCIEAMTSDRPYRPAKTMAEVAAELRRCAGTHFDPVVVEVFLGISLGEWEQLGASSSSHGVPATRVTGPLVMPKGVYQ